MIDGEGELRSPLARFSIPVWDTCVTDRSKELFSNYLRVKFRLRHRASKELQIKIPSAPRRP